MNTIKVLWCRFQQCFGTCAMLLVEASSKSRLFRHLSNHVFGVRNFGNTKVMMVIFFFKVFKISKRFQKCSKNFEKKICFRDNCIWIGIINSSLWRIRYFSLAANVLTSSPKISHVNKRDFFQRNFLCSDWGISARCCDSCFSSAYPRLPCCLSKGPLKRAFLHIYLTTFSESAVSERQKLWGSPFVSKCSKLNLDFKNGA